LRFLKTLFWLVVTALVILFAAKNWRDVTIDLWGNLQVDVKMPVLLLIAFLIGFLPTWLIFRTKLWRVSNRVSIPQHDAHRAIQEETEPAK
jgi:lipopolysaccharide assembly protein A